MLFLNTKRIFGVFLVVLFLFVFYNIEKKKLNILRKGGIILNLLLIVLKIILLKNFLICNEKIIRINSYNNCCWFLFFF